MAGPQPFFFVSHATADNAQLRPVVLALLDAGVALWFDKPQAVDIPFERFSGYISAGVDYKVAIDDRAIPMSSGFLMFPSAKTAASAQCKVEIRNALERHRAITQVGRTYLIAPVLMAADSLSHLDDDIDAFQGYRLTVAQTSDDAWQLTDEGAAMAAQFALDLKRHLAECETNPLPGAGKARGARESIANPYLVDRTEQRDSATASIVGAFQSAALNARIPLLVIHGGAEEAPDQVGCATLPRRVLRHLPVPFGKASEDGKLIEWPTAKPKDLKAFHQQMDSRLAEKFPLSARGALSVGPDGRKAIAAHIRTEAIFRVACFQLTSLKHDLKDRSALQAHIAAWCAYWDAFPLAEASLDGKPLLYPVLALGLAEPGAHENPNLTRKERADMKRREERDKNLRIALKKPNFTRDIARRLRGVEPVLLTELSPVTQDCIAEWVNSDTDSFPGLAEEANARLAVITSLREVFGGRETLPMRRWAEAALARLKAMDT